MVKGKPAGSITKKANKPKKERNDKKTQWVQCQCSSSSQIPIQDDPNYHQFSSLYKIAWRNSRIELIIYDTENEKEEIKALDTKLRLDKYTSITQLPNGELFCYGSAFTGTTVIIDRNYGVRMLPSGESCRNPSVLYFDNNIYCFGGWFNNAYYAPSRKFDLKNNRWIELAFLPKVDRYCYSVIFNENILISGDHCKNLWLYSIEINSFSIIPYDFKKKTRKLLINVEKLYLIEWYKEGLIYESEDEYSWKPISKSGRIDYFCNQTYCLYNKEKIYISVGKADYYHFGLRKKVLSRIN